MIKMNEVVSPDLKMNRFSEKFFSTDELCEQLHSSIKGLVNVRVDELNKMYDDEEKHAEDIKAIRGNPVYFAAYLLQDCEFETPSQMLYTWTQMQEFWLDRFQQKENEGMDALSGLSAILKAMSRIAKKRKEEKDEVEGNNKS